MSKNFVVEPFKSRKRKFRADKGKKHNYPKSRRCWRIFCQRQKTVNLSLNETNAHISSMDNQKVFKYPLEVRKFWREQKRKYRAKKKQMKGENIN